MAAAGVPVRLVPQAGHERRCVRHPGPPFASGADGLVPAVVQDAADGRVLMLAWMDAEALEATLATGEVHFHSRSRGPALAEGRDERQRAPARRPGARLRR